MNKAIETEEAMIECLIQKFQLINGLHQLLATVIVGGILDYKGIDKEAGTQYLQSNLFKRHCRLIGSNAWQIKELFRIDL